MQQYDLVIRTSNRNVAISNDRIAAVDEEISPPTKQTIEIPQGVLLAGLIDLHAHPARSGSVFGVDPDSTMLARGVTTVMSQGDAGADNIDHYVRVTIEACKTRVILAINLSRVGESTKAGCFSEFENADVDECVAAIDRHRKHVWGIAVNTSHHACEQTDPREILGRGLSAAAKANVPILYGMRRPEDWPLADQLKMLRPGDVVTYCFRRQPHCIVANGHVIPEVIEARERGVLFDVGHGGGSFDYEVAETAIGNGFQPDTISSDLHATHLGQSPQHDLPLVMSKLKAAGMPNDEIFRAVTTTPAKILGREIGTLKVGAIADITVLELKDSQSLLDTSGNSRKVRPWTSVLTIHAGKIV